MKRLLYAGQRVKHNGHGKIKSGTRQKVFGEVAASKFLIARAKQRLRPVTAHT